MARPEGQTESGKTADHDHGKKEGEETLVPLEEADHHFPGPARRGRHGR